MNVHPNPLISVVIPTYKHAHLIGRTLKSIVNQTYTNWEIIVVDNHSPDETDQVVQSFSDSRIRLLKIHNKGIIATSRNMGIREAKGEWIAFVDSDDWWTSNKLQECVAHITKDVDLIYHELKIVREKLVLFGEKKIHSWQVQQPVLIDLLVNGNAIANSSVVVRKEALLEIGGLSENAFLVACEDYHAWLKMAEIGKKFLYLPLQLGYYYLNEKGISKKDMFLPKRKAVIEFTNYLSDAEWFEVQCGLFYTKGRFEFVNRRYLQAEKYLKNSIKNKNFFIKVKSFLMLLYILLQKCRINS